jgi:spermidine synthase
VRGAATGRRALSRNLAPAAILRGVAKPVFEIVDSRATPIGVLDLRRRELPARPGLIVTEITINDDMLMSSLSTVSERALATSALALHAAGDGLRVLVGGLGLGYTAHVALADPRVAYVRVVDRVPAVIGWLREGLFPLSAELNGDDRLEVCESDVYAELLGPGREAYDLVLIDVDHSPTEPLDPASEPFYTWQGQRQVVDHLAPAGVLAVWSSDDDDDFAEVLEEVYPEARRERVRWVNELIDDEEIEEILFLARRA